LQRDIPVIPVLIDGTPPPKVQHLTPDLEELSLRSGIKIHNDSFHRDAEPLEKELQKLAKALEKSRLAQSEIAQSTVPEPSPPVVAPARSPLSALPLRQSIQAHQADVDLTGRGASVPP
jgi:hypothetical protein